MKKHETPQLDLDWWRKGKPALLRNKVLDVALENYEKRAAAYDATPGFQAHGERDNALAEVEMAASTVLAVCEKSKLGAYAETIEVLKQFPAFIEKKRKALDQQHKQWLRLQATGYSRAASALAERLKKIEEAGATAFQAASRKQAQAVQATNAAGNHLDALHAAVRQRQGAGQPDDRFEDFTGDAEVQRLHAELDTARADLGRRLGEIQAVSAQIGKWYGVVLHEAQRDAKTLNSDEAAVHSAELLAAVRRSQRLIDEALASRDQHFQPLVEDLPDWLAFATVTPDITVQQLRMLNARASQLTLARVVKLGAGLAQQAAAVKQGAESARLMLEKALG